MRIITILCLAVSAALAKPDSRWKLISRTRDIAVWIDSARVDSNRADKMIGVWLRFDYAKPDPVPGSDKLVYSQSQVELAIDCHRELVRDLSLEIFAPDGKPVGTASHDFPATPIGFAEHPFGHGTFVGVCAWLRAPDRWRPVFVDTSVVSH
jgi:Surface-adhesin protein E